MQSYKKSIPKCCGKEIFPSETKARKGFLTNRYKPALLSVIPSDGTTSLGYSPPSTLKLLHQTTALAGSFRKSDG